MPFLPKGWEIIVILIVVLILFGPKNLPKLGAALGKGVKNLRDGMGAGKKDKKEIEEAEDEEEVEEVEEEEAPAKKTVKKTVKKKSK